MDSVSFLILMDFMFTVHSVRCNICTVQHTLALYRNIVLNRFTKHVVEAPRNGGKACEPEEPCQGFGCVVILSGCHSPLERSLDWDSRPSRHCSTIRNLARDSSDRAADMEFIIKVYDQRGVHLATTLFDEDLALNSNMV